MPDRLTTPIERQRRSAILDAVNCIIRDLLMPGHWEAKIPIALEQLGLAAHADRVYLFQTIPDQPLAAEKLIRQIWNSPAFPPAFQQEQLEKISFSKMGLTTWTDELKCGRSVHGKKESFEQAAQNFLEKGCVEYAAMAPVFTGDTWWGVLGFDLCEKDRIFSSDELEVLEIAASIFGMAIYHEFINQHLEDQHTLAEALRDTASALTSSLQLDEVLQRILSNVGKVVPHDAANIQLLQDNGMSRIVGAQGYEQRGLQDLIMTIEFDMHKLRNLSQMYNEKLPLAIPDVKNYPGWLKTGPSEWLNSYAAAPMRLHGEVIGFLCLDSATPNFFQQEHAERLQVFADQAAVAIHNARLYEETRQRAHQVDMLNQITNLALTTPDVTEMLEMLAKRLLVLFSASDTHVVLWNEADPPFKVSNASTREKPVVMLDQSDSTLLEVSLEPLRQGEKLVVEDIRASKHIAPQMAKQLGAASLMALPMVVDGKNIGAVMIAFDRVQRFDTPVLHLADQAASQVALAVSKILLLEEVRQNAITDYLTGLYNRRGLYELGQRETKRARRFNRPLAAIMLDLDFFKTINDTFSHATGDAVLCGVSEVLQSGLREVDILSRWGGDEFLILLPENDLESGRAVAERLCEMVAQNTYATSDGDMRTSASFGVVQLQSGMDDLSLLIDAADRAMYLSKQSGRNRVTAK